MNNFIIAVEVKDKREEYLIKALQNDGYINVIIGQEKHFNNSKKVYVFAMVTNLTYEMVNSLEDNSIFFSRGLSNELTELTKNKNLRHFEFMDDETFVVKNAYLTAEGALSYIIQNTDASIRHMPILILGYGRVGKSLTKILRDNDADVYVATDDETEYALASTFATHCCSLNDISKNINNYQSIINTVPKIILKGDILKLINKNCFILDLASKPGGVDFSEAESLELNCIHALGVPGKLTPKSAGEYLEKSIVERLKKVEDE
jgi:dipicolinate synthase subunit A